MPLQIGNWLANIAGRNVPLDITNIGSDGAVTATLAPAGSSPITCQGFWDEDSQRLCIISQETSGSVMFTGYLFTDPVNLMGVRGSVFFTLAGIAEYFGASSSQTNPMPSAKRSSFGWYAQIGVD